MNKNLAEPFIAVALLRNSLDIFRAIDSYCRFYLVFVRRYRKGNALIWVRETSLSNSADFTSLLKVLEDGFDISVEIRGRYTTYTLTLKTG